MWNLQIETTDYTLVKWQKIAVQVLRASEEKQSPIYGWKRGKPTWGSRDVRPGSVCSQLCGLGQQFPDLPVLWFFYLWSVCAVKWRKMPGLLSQKRCSEDVSGLPATGEAEMLCKPCSLFLVLLSRPYHFLSCTVTAKSSVGETSKEIDKHSIRACKTPTYSWFLVGTHGLNVSLTFQVWVICLVECIHSLLFPVILDVLGILPGALDTSKADPLSRWPSTRCPIKEIVS